jgi:meiotic recombination protein SPO11
VSKLSAALPQAPVLVLTDADPHGIDIASVYQHGPLITTLGIPSLPHAQRIGMRIEDGLRVAHEFPASAIPLSEQDRSKARWLLSHKSQLLSTESKNQLETMLEIGMKFELEAMSMGSSTDLILFIKHHLE